MGAQPNTIYLELRYLISQICISGSLPPYSRCFHWVFGEVPGRIRSS